MATGASPSAMEEGPLMKWTNVVHGWQYRWFVLSGDSLCYYTSREKMLKRQLRGCIRLRGAVVGIDQENSSLFTVSVDNKTFHLQGRDSTERNAWVKQIERRIRASSGLTFGGARKSSDSVSGVATATTTEHSSRPNSEQPESTNASLKDKVREADALLAQISQHASALSSTASRSGLDADEKRHVQELATTAEQLVDTVKHSLILLQMARSNVDVGNLLTHTVKNNKPHGDHATVGGANSDGLGSLSLSVAEHSVSSRRSPSIAEIPLAPISYASSDDEFYDAEAETDVNGGEDGSEARTFVGESETHSDEGTNHTNPTTTAAAVDERGRRLSGAGASNWVDYPDDEDYDAIYAITNETDVGDVNSHGSVLMHLLSQVSIGMDLTKVTLPTFILERRSLLEMYADFFTHPDSFVGTAALQSPEQRFISVVKYYMCAFYAARKSGVAKKPYNPILGETFRCRYAVPGMAPTGRKTTSGPMPGSDESEVTFVAEQVSHHPPVSAFYAEHPASRVSFQAHIWTKSSFLGLSISVANVGIGSVYLHDLNEEYTVTFPCGYGRSIMSTPWVELGGKVRIACAQTGYSAEVEFLTKPMFGGKPHRITAQVYKDGSRRQLLSVKGEWNGVLHVKEKEGGDDKVWCDVRALPEVPKQCVPVMQQTDRESRRLWRHVTSALLRDDIGKASNAKRQIEQRQRDETKARQEAGRTWTPALFQLDGERWVYKEALTKRSAI